MKKITIIIIIALLLIWRVFIWLSPFFTNNSNNRGFLSCTEYYTSNQNNKKIIEQVNLIKKDRIKKLGLKCGETRIIKIDIEKNKVIESSTIWGLYEEVIKSNLRNYNISSFIDELYGTDISTEEKNRILEEIKSWLDDPQMPDDIRKLIERGLK
jgi:hypothetical protein